MRHTQTILLQTENSGAAPAVLKLSPGQEATFGRGTDTDPADFSLGHAEVSRRAGIVKAESDYWLLTNLSRGATLVVENPEGGGEFLKVPPGRLAAPVPFEFARVLLPAAGGSCSFLVFASRHSYADFDSAEVTTGGEPTIAGFSLDASAKYFLILVALCEPRLRNCSSSVIPTVPEVLERLHLVPGCETLTRAAVNFHIDYLAREKLRVKPSSGSRKADWQRTALVSVALRFDLVREEHLALLGH
ncbi:serine/threonine protein kinase [Streptosporangium minutum]|uniref:Serine/threonine protein kinase n=1 Tax=Streptosporangium minutum TaxID=569862 RepID=A0A243RJK3_9ACTN|nr:serine/threonine protein kinase [Streptosporangium minutum]OUC95073.1 serine/threonine protein kinase [Streptosporangium minutum]